MVLIWGGLFLFLSAAILIGIESRGTIFNRYDDWMLFSHELIDTSFLTSQLTSGKAGGLDL